jgi:hypothetical protein
MINAITSLSPVAVVVVALLGFGLGAVWYSRVLFGRAWMEEMRLTPEIMRENAGRAPVMLGGAVLFTLVSTFALAALVAALHVSAPLKGAELGLFAGAGLVAARQGTNALFESRTPRLFLIVSGYDVVQLTVQGAVLAVWR